MCLIHFTVPDLLADRCDNDERKGKMRSETKEGGHMQDRVLMHEGERRGERGERGGEDE